MASFVKVTADNSQTDAKRKAREARFKNGSKKTAPPKPKRSFAHPGGKITHNKEAALAAYLKRKKGRLTEDQKAMLANLEKLKKVNDEKKEEKEVQAVEKKPTSPIVATVAKARVANNSGAKRHVNPDPPKSKATTTISVVANQNRKSKDHQVTKGVKKPHNVHRWRSRNHSANPHRNDARSTELPWSKQKRIQNSDHQWKPWRGFKNDA